MKKFIVEIPIAGSFTVEVEAADSEAAKDAAWAAIDAHEGSPEDLGEVHWEYFDTIAEGNVCHAPRNSVEVSDA